jgi:hypothetical protein
MPIPKDAVSYYGVLKAAAPAGIAEAFERHKGVPAERAEPVLVWINAGNHMTEPSDINLCFQNAREAAVNNDISYDDAQDFVRAYDPNLAMPG